MRISSLGIERAFRVESQSAWQMRCLKTVRFLRKEMSLMNGSFRVLIRQFVYQIERKALGSKL